MEKIFASIGLVCLAGFIYLKGFTGYEGRFLVFLAIGLAAFSLAYIGLIFAYAIPKFIALFSLRLTTFTLRLVYFVALRFDAANTYRITLLQKIGLKYDVTRLLMRKNSSLNMEIEKLRAEVAILNTDIKTLVSTWSPALKETLSVAPQSARKSVLDRKPRGEMTFVEPQPKQTKEKTPTTEMVEANSENDTGF